MGRNRLSEKRCVLCDAPSTRRGEHVWPHWLIESFSGEGPFHTEKSGKVYLRRDGQPTRHEAPPGVHVPMCKPCNSLLNRTIEVPAKATLKRLIPASADHDWPRVSAAEANALARWFLKVGILLTHPDAVHVYEPINSDPAWIDSRHTQASWLDWMRRAHEPPRDFSVFLARRSPLSEQPWLGRQVEIPLPGSVRVAGVEERLMVRSFGVQGIDATILWHPGVPFVHPATSTRQLARVWPDPTATDFDTLHEAHPHEWVIKFTGECLVAG